CDSVSIVGEQQQKFCNFSRLRHTCGIGLKGICIVQERDFFNFFRPYDSSKKSPIGVNWAEKKALQITYLSFNKIIPLLFQSRNV
ncbi:hypothetical protein, partial [Acinetobacter brisouii]